MKGEEGELGDWTKSPYYGFKALWKPSFLFLTGYSLLRPEDKKGKKKIFASHFCLHFFVQQK